MTGTPSLLQRHNLILALVNDLGQVSIAELCERYGVSAVTIRSDLAELERQGAIRRRRGFAVKRVEARVELGFHLRQGLQIAEKERIGRAAARLVRNGDSVALDASTTAWHVARNLKRHHELTVITNGLFIALEFLDSGDATVIMPGGWLRRPSGSLVGQNGAYLLEKYHIQKGFFGARGFSLEQGLTEANEYEVELKRHMMQNCDEVIGIVDASKWGEVSVVSLITIDEVHRLITDTAAPMEMVHALHNLGVEVVLA